MHFKTVFFNISSSLQVLQINLTNVKKIFLTALELNISKSAVIIAFSAKMVCSIHIMKDRKQRL